MVFTTTNLFKGIPCPKGAKCKLTNCIYAHDAAPDTTSSTNESRSASAQAKQQPAQIPHEPTEPANKRRKITYESLADKPPSRADEIRNQLASTRAQQNNAATSQTSVSSGKSLASLAAPVSPPPTRAMGAIAAGAGNGISANKNGHKTGPHGGDPKDDKTESLNPRLINNDPVGHQKRLLYLKHLHTEMARLNKQVQTIESKRLCFLSEQKLIKLCLNEEEKIARDQPKVYPNVIKQRLAALKKMTIEQWLEHINITFLAIEPPKLTKKTAEKVINTGLQSSDEHLLLPQLVVIDQKSLASHGYIAVPPSEAQAAEAAAAVEASKNYEECDRCSSRFQMFPNRDENGRLASNGPCFFHPYRKVFPPREKSDRETGSKEPYHPCCNEKVGSSGCTRHEEHVFKTSSPARLAAIMPFVNTPENPSPARDRRGNVVKAVTFDCEMGYTTFGMELIRLTAVSWPAGEPLLDTLVRPLGKVIDFNSRFSGVFHETISKAIPYDTWEKQWQSSKPPPPPDENGVLPIVDSPQRARELLCSFITPTTPLIGHAIDNDLNTVRLCHPTIVDTVVLYPHPRGLPMRFGLRMLTQKHLNRYIQTGGDRGHDSLEDAVATGDLVRVKVGEKWSSLQAHGWKIIDHQLIPPPPRPPPSQEALDAQRTQNEARLSGMVEKAIFGTKRKKRASMDGADDGEAEEEELSNGESAAAIDNDQW